MQVSIVVDNYWSIGQSLFFSKKMTAASPVDKGWAWVVCTAGGFLHVLVIGTIRSTGILLAKVSEHYNRSKRDTSWIMSFMFLLFMLLSPITMAMARRYTARRVVFVGGIFLSAGFSLSYFATSLEFLYLTIGVLVGTGISMTHSPTVLLVNYYFDRHRTVAMGITMAGGSIGALCIPALINLMADHYTFRGCMLLWGGVMLNVAVAGALMRPFVEKKDAAAASANSATDDDGTDEAKERLVMAEESPVPPPAEEKATTGKSVVVGTGRHHCDRHCKSAENLHCREHSCADLRRAASTAVLRPQKHSRGGNKLAATAATAGPPKLTMLASCGDVSILIGQPATVAALATLPPPDETAEKGAEPAAPKATTSRARPCGLLCRAIAALNLNPRLVRSPRFWFMISGLAIAIQGMPFNLMILPQHGKSIGMPASEYTLLLQYQGIPDFIVRIGIGLLADRQLFRRQLMLVALVVGQGVLWCLLLCPTAPAALAFSLLEGVLAGGTITNLAPILVDSFGVENLPSSYGLMGLVESVVMMVFPVLLGDLFDKTGSWSASIIVVSIVITTSGLMLLTDDFLHQRSLRRKHNSKQESG